MLRVMVRSCLPVVQSWLEESCDKVTQDGSIPIKKGGFQNKEVVAIRKVADETGLQQMD